MANSDWMAVELIYIAISWCVSNKNFRQNLQYIIRSDTCPLTDRFTQPIGKQSPRKSSSLDLSPVPRSVLNCWCWWWSYLSKVGCRNSTQPLIGDSPEPVQLPADESFAASRSVGSLKRRLQTAVPGWPKECNNYCNFQWRPGNRHGHRFMSRNSKLKWSSLLSVHPTRLSQFTERANVDSLLNLATCFGCCSSYTEIAAKRN